MMNTNVSLEICTRKIPVAPIILWHRCQPEQLIDDLSIQGQCLHTSSPHLLIHDLQQLLCRLFPYTQTILVEALPHGFSPARVIKVQPFYEQGGGGRQVVVKFGEIPVMRREYENYQKYVQHFIGDGHSTAVLNYQQAMYLGAISYAFLGAGTHQMQEFGSFYQHASLAHIRHALDVLLRQTCGMWYANHDALQPLNLTEAYQRQFGYTMKELEQTTRAHLDSVSWQKTLIFKALPNSGRRRFSQPSHILNTVRPVIRTTYSSTTHGDLNQRNILIDQVGSAWLIDFQDTGPSHILRDVAMLDALIRLQLLHSEQATLAERLALEEAICAIKHFDQLEEWKSRYVTDNPALAKVWETIVHLRMLARWMIEKNPFGEMSEYTLVLLYSTMNTLSFASLEKVQREHALLSASLLVDVLGENGTLHR